MWRMYYGGAFLILLVAGLLEARYVGPTRQGLSFQVSAVPSEIYLPDQVVHNEVDERLFPRVSTLTVHVHDVNQKPMQGVAVAFEMEPGCQSVATLSSSRAISGEEGVAYARVEPDDTTGVCRIAVRVDNLTQTVRVTVSTIPDLSEDDAGERARDR